MDSMYKIDKTDSKNRFMIAKKQINKGQIILEQNPMACFSLSFNRNLVC